MLEAMITSTEIVWHQLWFKRYVVAGLRVFHRITNKDFFWHQAECSQHDILSFWPYWEILDYYAVFLHVTQHGLRTPNKAFFHKNPKLLGLGRHIGQIKFWAFWVFSHQFINIHFGTVSPLSMFSTIQPLKKLSLYIHIPNIYLGLGFKFGPQRIRDLTIIRP